MHCDPTVGLRPGLHLGLRRAISSLAFALCACQTPISNEQAAKEVAVLEAQKAIVRNQLDSGKPEVALETLRPLLREHANDANLHDLMGITQLTLKNSVRAVKEFQLAYKLDKKVSTGLNLSSALIGAGDNGRAIRLLTQLVKQADTDSYAYKERILHNLGYAYVKQGNLKKAEDWFKQALDENPTFFLSHLELARIYEKSKRPTMAMTSYRKSMDYCTTCLEPVQALAALYVRMGKTADARRTLMQYSKVEGVAPEDRTRAGQLLHQITLTGLPPIKRGG